MRDDSFRDYVLDQLTPLAVTARAIFGGHGIYHRGEFFAILHGGRLYFRTDTASRAAYVERGMQPFRPNARQTLTTYYEVPPEVLEDGSELLAWARTALATGAEKRRK